MQLKKTLLVSLCASLLLSACSLPTYEENNGSSARIEGVNNPTETTVYQQAGMEISSITARMADQLQQNMFYHLLPNAPVDRSSVTGDVKIVTMPRIAITSFVDTDTYENAGYLGRALAEFFTHEMSTRAFEVTEYKLTGKLAVTNDGDFILSRNWKKIAKDTKVKYLLGGTFTRNSRGVVVVSRVVNMQTRQVIATATDVIPYSLLPTCYRTAAKNCSFTGISSEQLRDASYYKKKYLEAEKQLALFQAPMKAEALERARTAKALTKAQVVGANGRPLGGVFETSSDPAFNPAAAAAAAAAQSAPVVYNTGYNTGYTGSGSTTPVAPGVQVGPDGKKVYTDPRFKKGVVSGATSRGNYDRYVDERDGFSSCDLVGCKEDPVVYPANTYMHNTMLIRDTADESSYSRVSN
ncbi:FlgO family outer membrane protein [Anaerobiospirillum sp. NML02-A-032]|uniref:FlgO family outer membrane protein n=1 Tax=Anaerobiospirillum sp. NML02-A-032 TaxID=2932818 RepID=UPI001FF0DF23|nr:FlgO family outer membrane protein [Anaerobiospirillum sp. NML02-A-032]MCK0539592.1 FlgO family outer membrane protein [Anaerobiospirillum sp. NML02-A-032]